MPRRNRNAHATAINADELAEQADQLTAEFGAITAYLVHDRRFSRVSIPSADKPAILHDYSTTWAYERPGCKLVLVDRQRELAEVVTSDGRH